MSHIKLLFSAVVSQIRFNTSHQVFIVRHISKPIRFFIIKFMGIMWYRRSNGNILVSGMTNSKYSSFPFDVIIVKRNWYLQRWPWKSLSAISLNHCPQYKFSLKYLMIRCNRHQYLCSQHKTTKLLMNDWILKPH